MNSGKKFEQNWEKSIPSHIFYHRIKDSASAFGKDSSFTKYTPQNPYDYFIFYTGFLFPMELKTSKDRCFSFQRAIEEKGKDIKLHQIKALTESAKFDGVVPGFVFDCIEHGTFWMHINNFNNFFSESDKKSINLKDIIRYGGIETEKSLMRVNYKYDIESLLKAVIKGEMTNG